MKSCGEIDVVWKLWNFEWESDMSGNGKKFHKDKNDLVRKWNDKGNYEKTME